jgi:pimeloyl-ACP methyl ester carboxylesterase
VVSQSTPAGGLALEGDLATYVLIPGAGGAGSYWHLVAGELRSRGHEAVAVDLPARDDAAGLAEYVDAVVDAIGDRSDVILVAQSMGGFTAPLVTERASVAMLVLVNAMIPAPGETPGEWWANTGAPEAKRRKDTSDGRDPDAPFDPIITFFHDVPADVREEAFKEDPGQSDTPFASPMTLAAWPDVPTRVIVGADDRLFPADFQRRVAQERLGITPDERPGGHLIALSHPTEVAEQLEAYRRALIESPG